MTSRKRRAPGASPIGNTYQDTSNAATDTYMSGWNDPSAGDMGGFTDATLYDGLNIGGNMNQPSTHNRVVSLDGLNGNSDVHSGQLVRRNPNQQLAARGRNAWGTFSPDPGGAWEAADDDEELERKALIAKKEAQSKRKQIPPFVQKLSRYELNR